MEIEVERVRERGGESQGERFERCVFSEEVEGDVERKVVMANDLAVEEARKQERAQLLQQSRWESKRQR
jgi:hypothetical protein